MPSYVADESRPSAFHETQCLLTVGYPTLIQVKLYDSSGRVARIDHQAALSVEQSCGVYAPQEPRPNGLACSRR